MDPCLFLECECLKLTKDSSVKKYERESPLLLSNTNIPPAGLRTISPLSMSLCLLASELKVRAKSLRCTQKASKQHQAFVLPELLLHSNLQPADINSHSETNISKRALSYYLGVEECVNVEVLNMAVGSC